MSGSEEYQSSTGIEGDEEEEIGRGHHGNLVANSIMQIGKHAGKSYGVIREQEPGYCGWVIRLP